MKEEIDVILNNVKLVYKEALTQGIDLKELDSHDVVITITKVLKKINN